MSLAKRFKTSISLRNRIFLAMTGLVVLSSFFMAIVTLYQYQEQSYDYHKTRLNRKELQLVKSLQNELRKSEESIDEEHLKTVFENEIYSIASIHNVDFSIYNLAGELLLQSNFIQENQPEELSSKPRLAADFQRQIIASESSVIIEPMNSDVGFFFSSYFKLRDIDYSPVAIVHLPYFEEDTFNKKELREFMIRISGVYFLLLIVALSLSYIVSTYITKNLKAIASVLSKTDFNAVNENIVLSAESAEIQILIDSYNKMIEALKSSAERLAKSEREQAWREMAKQVAHEIKNPLTPMRLQIQEFEHNYKQTEKIDPKELKEFAQTLIEQIDIMSNIATAFSDFAQFPKTKSSRIDLVAQSKRIIDLFNQVDIEFEHDTAQLEVTFDKDQWSRILTNLIKNAIEATEHQEQPYLAVKIRQTSNEVYIEVIDSGDGVQQELEERIFEPKFTTKNSGMGLGLAIVKKSIEYHGGQIQYSRREEARSCFKIQLPLNN